MNEIMTREEFLKERNAVCESDAVAGGDDVCKGQDADTAVMTEENGKLSADGITVSEVVVKGRRNRQYAGLILFITAVAGAVVGAVFYGKATVTVPDEMFGGLSRRKDTRRIFRECRRFVHIGADMVHCTVFSRALRSGTACGCAYTGIQGYRCGNDVCGACEYIRGKRDTGFCGVCSSVRIYRNGNLLLSVPPVRVMLKQCAGCA